MSKITNTSDLDHDTYYEVFGSRSIDDIVDSALKMDRTPAFEKVVCSARIPAAAHHDLKALASNLNDTVSNLASQILVAGIIQARQRFEDVTGELPLDHPEGK